jgi:hypothetical protein
LNEKNYFKTITIVNKGGGRRDFIYIMEKIAYFAFSSEYTHHILRFVLLEGRGAKSL